MSRSIKLIIHGLRTPNPRVNRPRSKGPDNTNRRTNGPRNPNPITNGPRATYPKPTSQDISGPREPSNL